MALLHSRTNLITVRLSTEEHETLKRLCAREGARSISDFVREIILQRTSVLRGNTGLLTRDLLTLTVNLQELNTSLNDLSDRILGLLGGPATSATPPPEQDGDGELDCA
jgi:hypothetical protein